MFDFYMLCSKHWNISYEHAVRKVLDLYRRSGGVYVAQQDVGEPKTERISRLQPGVLSQLPNDVRVAVLEHYGFHLGQN